MSAFVLHDTSDQAGIVRWGSSAALIVAAHAALIALVMAWYTQPQPPGVSLPAILVDMSPVSAAPKTTPVDLAPGPEMQQANASPPPEVTKQEAIPEQIIPTPPQVTPIVEPPPELKVQPTPPEPAKIVPDRPKPVPVTPKPVRAEARKPTDALPAPRTSASPRAERQAPTASAAAATGASAAAALASYNQQVAAHLQHFKQYPSSSKAAGERGTARLSFSLGRGGQVLGSRLAGSSGYAALDAETLAMVRRAQPFPPIPPEMKQTSVSFTVPINFSIR